MRRNTETHVEMGILWNEILTGSNAGRLLGIVCREVERGSNIIVSLRRPGKQRLYSRPKKGFFCRNNFNNYLNTLIEIDIGARIIVKKLEIKSHWQHSLL